MVLKPIDYSGRLHIFELVGTKYLCSGAALQCSSVISRMSFIIKRGWRDSGAPGLIVEKKLNGFADRDDISNLGRLA